jgi:hypothetical protein
MPVASPSVTALSHRPVRSSPILGRIAGLARESLIVVLGMSAASCLVADPPEYTPPEQTPPVLNLFLADPPVNSVLLAPRGEQLSFNVPVRSEDAGDKLVAARHLDWGSPRHEFVGLTHVPPSTFDDESRVISFDWTVMAEKGCHQLTLLVFHFSNSSEDQSSTVVADQAMAAWWLNVDPEETDPDTLKDCHPASTGVMP